MSYINQFLFSVSLLFLLCSFFTCAAITISLTVHLFFFVTTAHLLKSLTLSFRWKCDSLKYRFAIFLLKQAPPPHFSLTRKHFLVSTQANKRDAIEFDYCEVLSPFISILLLSFALVIERVLLVNLFSSTRQPFLECTAQ